MTRPARLLTSTNARSVLGGSPVGHRGLGPVPIAWAFGS